MDFTFGNLKLPDTTLIFNMGTAKRCPSRERGLCATVNCGIKCYALKAEEQYPNTVPQYRTRQEISWKESTAEGLFNELNAAIKRRRKKTTHIRFNESGDFWSQEDINKLNYISERMKKDHGIITYGYTARRDLDFSVKKFILRGSGFINDNLNGSTIVISNISELPPNFIMCPGSCKTCNICTTSKKTNIAFLKH